MNKEKELILEKLRNIKQTAESYFKENNFENYAVKNVIHYNRKVELINKETGKKEEFDLYAVIAENTNPEMGGDDIFELEYLEDKEGNIVTISDLIQEYEGFANIKDVVDKTKENEEKPEEEQDKELKKDTLEELEEEKEQEEKNESKEEKVEEKKLTSDKAGATSLDQEVDRRTLRNLIGLDGDDAYIKPISASQVKSKYGVNINTKEGIEIIKQDGTSRLAGEDIFKQDSQEGNNSFNRDLNMKVDGSVEYESNTTSLELANMPNHYISIGYDDMTTKREIKFSKRSGREGHREPEKELLKEGASEYIDPDQRNMRRRNEEGIGEPDEIVERYEAEKEAGCDDIRVEDVDNYENNDTLHIDPDEKIEGTDITWRQFANKCGYRGEDGLQKAHKEFIDYKLSHKDLANDEVVEEVVEEIENEMPGPNRDRR